MNRQRRKQLREALDLLEKARSIIETCADEEQDAFDNLPESLQYGEKGEQMEEFIEILVDSYDCIDEIGAHIETDVIDA